MATTSLGVDCGPAQQGFQSVVFCDGKMRQEIVRLARALLRLDRRAVYHESARAVTVHDPTRMLKGDVLIVTAGTADIPVAEKARVTAEVMGSRVETIYDVGVAGLHRVLARLSRLLQARVVVVVAAGMDGVLPSVVGGLIDCPVIAVPTSIGYGANFGGVAPLLTMLNSCASGMGVVNINNGFGAGCLAHRINIMAGKYGISVPASVSSNGASSRLNRKDTRPSNKGGPHGEPIRETQAVHSDRR